MGAMPIVLKVTLVEDGCRKHFSELVCETSAANYYL